MAWGRNRRQPEIRRLGPAEFKQLLPAAFRIFADAMGYPDSYIEPRIRLALTQLAYPGLTVFGAFDDARLVGFGYGYRIRSDQWWAGQVDRALRLPGADRSRRWLSNSFELCELHMAPDAQGRGTGRALLRAVTAAQPCPTILLSTPSGPTKAASLYAAEGYLPIASRFRFSGDPRDFEILAKVLADG